MINKIIGLVKKQKDIDYNLEGYKITKLEIKVDSNSQEYFITFRDTFTDITYKCINFTQLNNVLKQYGFDNLLEVK